MKSIIALCIGFMVAPSTCAASLLQSGEIKACPEEFPVGALKLSPKPAGWVDIPPAKLLLTSADIILGPPEGAAVQIGKRQKTRTGFIMTFDHLYTTDPEPVQKWLACRYCDLTLAGRLPDNTESCTFTYTRNAYNSHDVQFACRTKR